jgi:hypothetical protein
MSRTALSPILQAAIRLPRSRTRRFSSITACMSLRCCGSTLLRLHSDTSSLRQRRQATSRAATCAGSLQQGKGAAYSARAWANQLCTRAKHTLHKQVCRTATTLPAPEESIEVAGSAASKKSRATRLPKTQQLCSRQTRGGCCFARLSAQASQPAYCFQEMNKQAASDPGSIVLEPNAYNKA